jgi:hypothetical protein
MEKCHNGTRIFVARSHFLLLVMESVAASPVYLRMDGGQELGEGLIPGAVVVGSGNDCVIDHTPSVDHAVTAS